MNLGRWKIDDFLTFTCNTHTASTGAATDATGVPTYRVYEDETGTPILTGSMAKLDDANTLGFYSERIQLTAANGFEVDKQYSIYISATVGGIEGTISHNFQVALAVPTAVQIADQVWDEVASGHVTAGTFGDKLANKIPSATIADYRADVSALALEASVQTIDGIVDQILVDTGTTLPAEHALLATQASVDVIDGIVDAILVDTGTTLPGEHALLATAANLATVDTVVDAIKVVTDALPDGGALTTLDANVDAILVDTGTTLPAEHALLATSASIAALNDLSAADIQTIIETNDLDHLAKVAHPTGDPVADTLFDLIMNKDVSQTFDRSTDSLEALRDENYEGPTAGDIADAVWDEAIAGHVSAGTFGAKNQNLVPSETIGDYKADVSALALAADLATVDTVVDAIKAVTDLLPDGGALTTIDANIDAILVDTGTTLPATLTTIEGKIDTVDANVDAILVDTGTTLPGEHALLATAASIAALNDLSSADVQTVLEANDLDHLAKIAHPTGDPVQDTLFDLVMNKDASQTFNRATDSLEVIGESAGLTAEQVANAVWDEAAADHTTATTFGGKNQIGVPSATLNDYKADVSALATAANLTVVDNVVDAIKAVTDNLPNSGSLTDLAAIKAVTDNLPDSGALTTIDANVDAILVDTGTTIPAQISALNDLSSADIQTVLETNDLDHLAKVAHPSGDPVADTLFDLIMNKDGSQTFDRSTDALEAVSEAGGGSTPAAIADAVWDELAAGHVGAGSFGLTNQTAVPSAVLNDYKADVSALATAANLATHDGKLDTVDTVVDAIKAVTDLLPDGGALTTIDSNIDAVLVDTNELQTDWTDGGRLDLILDDILLDTGTTLPASLGTLATAAALAVVDSNVDAILVDTGTSLPATLAGIISDISDVSDDLDDHDSDIKDELADLDLAVAAVKTDTESIIAVVGGVPVGAITFVYNVTNQISGNPIADADVWVTTDPLGNNAVASGRTDAFGNVTFYLDAGTYYFWTQKSGFNFENPDTEVVS